MRFQTNSLRYRDREWAPPGDARAEERRLRVAVLGNSISAGGGVELEEGWARRLEARLREAVRDDPRWDEALVMNVSGPAYGLEQMVRVHEDQVRPYAPDVVIASLGVHSLRPLRPSRTERDWPLKRQIVSTALYDWFQREVLRVHGAGGFVEEEALAPEEREELRAFERGTELLRGRPFSDEARPLWEAGQARLEAMSALVAELRARGLPASEVWAMDAAHRPPALEHLEQTVYFFHDREHLTARGHAVLAELLAAELRSALVAGR